MEPLLRTEFVQVAVLGVAEDHHTGVVKEVEKACQLQSRSGDVTGIDFDILGIIGHIGHFQVDLLDDFCQAHGKLRLHKSTSVMLGSDGSSV